jgi:hypothetical protein
MTVDQMFESTERSFKIFNKESKTWIWTSDEVKLTKAKEFILNSCEDVCKTAFTKADSPEEMLAKLSLRFGGFEGKDVDLYKRDISVFFPKHINPTEVFDQLDGMITKLIHAGGTITSTEQVVILVNGLKDLDFWKMVCGEILQAKLCTWDPIEVRKKIQSGWQAYGGPEARKEHLKGRVNETKIQVNQVWVPRNCIIVNAIVRIK